MRGWDAIIEGKIAEAQTAGAFDDLPGAGKPLDLDDDRLVPEDVRAAYRILRNAGYVIDAEGRRFIVAAIINDPNAWRGGPALDYLVQWVYQEAGTYDRQLRR